MRCFENSVLRCSNEVKCEKSKLRLPSNSFIFFSNAFLLSQHVMLQDVAGFAGVSEMSRDVQVNFVTNPSRRS